MKIKIRNAKKKVTADNYLKSREKILREKLKHGYNASLVRQFIDQIYQEGLEDGLHAGRLE